MSLRCSLPLCLLLPAWSLVLLLPFAAAAVPADLDDDGITNGVETSVGLDPNDPADAVLDLDADGWSNLDEYRLGSLGRRSPEFGSRSDNSVLCQAGTVRSGMLGSATWSFRRRVATRCGCWARW